MSEPTDRATHNRSAEPRARLYYFLKARIRLLPRVPGSAIVVDEPTGIERTMTTHPAMWGHWWGNFRKNL